MRPRFHPWLVNDRFGDPAVYVGFLLERRAMLFDLGDIRSLTPRAILRLSDIFVSHAHIDHFFGFDHLLRILVGRDKQVRLFGPAGFIDRVAAKLNSYTWNLAGSFDSDLVFSVTELTGNGQGRRAKFRLKNAFAREADHETGFPDNVALDETSLQVRFSVLEHRTPCLAFALQEKEHINIWKNRVAEMGLSVGPWLAALKRAIHERQADETPIRVQTTASTQDTLPLGLLRAQIVSITQGQKIGYVTDAAPTPDNAKAIKELVNGADILFIEAVFAHADRDIAMARAHLTARQAGGLAGKAGVARVEPFHFSPRYGGNGAMLVQEVAEAFDSTKAASLKSGPAD